MTIGEKIQARRKELRMTTEELGDIIGVQRSAITKYEKGRVELKASQILAIAKALMVSPVDLLDDDGPRTITSEDMQFLSAYHNADDAIKASVRKLLDILLHRFTKGDRSDPLLRRSIIETFINAVYVYDDHLKIIINNVEGNDRIPFSDLPPECSDNDNSGLPSVSRPNSRITIYRIAV